MLSKSLTKVLREIGLEENEAEVYLAALSRGPSTVLQLARVSEIKRPTMYGIVASLQQKGLMSVETHGFKKLYVPEDPNNLELVLERRKSELHKSLPELLALYNTKGTDGFIRSYEGLTAVKGVYEELLRDIRPHEEYLVISAQEQIFSLDERYFTDFIERRAKLPIKIRLLLQN